MAARFSPATADRLLRDDWQSNVAIQVAQTSSRESVKRFKLDSDLSQKLAGARDEGELRGLLLPTIESAIVRPRFEELNEYWRDSLLPTIETQAESMLATARKGRGLLPEEETLWLKIEGSAKAMTEVADSVKFEPPSDPEWWSSVSGKRAALQDIGEATERIRCLHFVVFCEAIC